jgi:hypothetical protein
LHSTQVVEASTLRRYAKEKELDMILFLQINTILMHL